MDYPVTIESSTADAGDVAGAVRYIVDALPDEPLFMIRGRDVMAVPVLDAYMKRCDDHGQYGQSDRVGLHRDRFTAWQMENAKQTRMPDPLPEGDEPEAKS